MVFERRSKVVGKLVGVKRGGGRLMGERGRGVGGETNGRCRWLRGGEDVGGCGLLVERGTKAVINK